ncbi:permease [Lacrimispora defluvii]|uniref:Permease n=1 Tax=Lacrimispora defluvii TaxID=2719233 RepID=A0ABX1VSG3_9FIRM|nr:permease [Lacrimispora defluvii]NNJ31301.1 permease [Lacrimispora defluvii]
MKRYRYAIVMIFVIGIIILYDRQAGLSAVSNAGMQLKQMFFVIPPIFLLLGLLDVWVPRTTMVKYMGEGSGIKGILLAFLIGSAAAGPLYGAFPVAAVFMKKGVKFLNLMVFIGAWSTTKIPMLMFEIESLGLKFALTRLAIDIPGIILIAFLLRKLISKREMEEIYKNSEIMA